MGRVAVGLTLWSRSSGAKAVGSRNARLVLFCWVLEALSVAARGAFFMAVLKSSYVDVVTVSLSN